ncbi:hypothetical protein [Hymenobacter lapidiphilus]|uniref:Uncharacterized protein n=1 Tax=Hymenobacter lapidiphilus TaxID=2608003 RepID=A0A7Y7U856_9BACT|nr:hypothetical protein [Hymenobacter lapidiphilus]NVO33210.1 hypothetical protein [Hymenobacter lapidiphilus]
MLDLLAFALSCALVSVAWCVILVDSGMLLEPVQRWSRGWYTARRPGVISTSATSSAFRSEFKVAYLDDQWWFKPIWGCYRCNSVWWALLGYPLAFGAAYSLWAHLVAVCATLFLSCLVEKAYRWSQS